MNSTQEERLLVAVEEQVRLLKQILETLQRLLARIPADLGTGD